MREGLCPAKEYHGGYENSTGRVMAQRRLER